MNVPRRLKVYIVSSQPLNYEIVSDNLKSWFHLENRMGVSMHCIQPHQSTLMQNMRQMNNGL